MTRVKAEGEGGRQEGGWCVCREGGGWVSLTSVYIRSLVGSKLMNRKWQKHSLPFGVVREGWSNEGKIRPHGASGHQRPSGRTQVLQPDHMDAMYV